MYMAATRPGMPPVKEIHATKQALTHTLSKRSLTPETRPLWGVGWGGVLSWCIWAHGYLPPLPIAVTSALVAMGGALGCVSVVASRGLVLVVAVSNVCSMELGPARALGSNTCSMGSRGSLWNRYNIVINLLSILVW